MKAHIFWHASSEEIACLRRKSRKPIRRKIVLHLRDLDHVKSAVLSRTSLIKRHIQSFDLDFLACGLAERAQIRIHGAGLADDEARHKAENGIVDLGVLGDADRSAAGSGRQLCGPEMSEKSCSGVAR
jgi:hypothetical protein